MACFLYINLLAHYQNMSKRGPKPKGKVKIEWSANFAYAIGLFVTDGCVYRDGRHLDFTSIDLEQIDNLKHCFGMKVRTTMKSNGRGSWAYRLQWSDIPFVKFLYDIGITPAKSLTIGAVKIPDTFFFDFFRGCLDGDGSSYCYWDKRWKNSYMFYIEITSASLEFICWLKMKVMAMSGAKGHITKSCGVNICYQLKYSKHEAVKIIDKIYSNDGICLNRKKLKICGFLATMNTEAVENAQVA